MPSIKASRPNRLRIAEFDDQETLAYDKCTTTGRQTVLLKVYQVRIKPAQPSFWERQKSSLWSGKEVFDELPFGTQLLAGTAMVAGAIALAPIEGAVGTAAAVTAVTAAAAAGAVAMFSGSSPAQVKTIDDLDELAKFHTVEGNGFVQGSFYIQHPKKLNCLILSSKFHRLLALEQVAELAAYLRSKVGLTRIHIEIYSQKGGSIKAKATSGTGQTAEAGASFQESKSLVFSNTYVDPQLVPMVDSPL